MLLICLKCGFGCSLYASKSISASSLSSTTAARKHQWNWNCILTATCQDRIKKTATELPTSALFRGYKLWSQRTLHQYLSPWLKKLQCNGNNASRNDTLLKRGGKHYCKADPMIRMKWDISTWQNHNRIKTEYVETLCNWHFQKSFNVNCLLSQHFHNPNVACVLVLSAVWRRGHCSLSSQSCYFIFLKAPLKIHFEPLLFP